MYSRNIPMTEGELSVFKAKIWKYVVLFISNNYYIYLKRYFEKIVTNEFLVYSGAQLR